MYVCKILKVKHACFHLFSQQVYNIVVQFILRHLSPFLSAAYSTYFDDTSCPCYLGPMHRQYMHETVEFIGKVSRYQ